VAASGAGPAAPVGLDLLADAAELQRQADRVAAAIDADHPEGVTLVGVLKGSVVFLADLARRLTVPVRLELVAIAPYDGSTTRTRVVKDLDGPIVDDHVVLVTGIVDTGLTADFLLRHLRQGGLASIRVCALADKQARRLLPVTVDYAAIEAPDRFLVGYGLDYAGRYRNVDGLWCGDGSALAADPDCYLDALYRGRAGHDRR
jgi:hypoxanthine phosphoribosyltransferase